MSTWVNDLLNEWRQRLAARSQPDSARPTEETGEAPTRALDLLRTHIKQSGVLLRLAEVKTAPAVAARPALHPVSTDTARDVPQESGADGDDIRFGKRRHSFRAPDTSHRAPVAGPVPIKRWNESPAPSDTRRAADAFRAAAYGEVEALRGDVARLKETLADILVENRELKRLVEVQSKGQSVDRDPAAASGESDAGSVSLLH